MALPKVFNLKNYTVSYEPKGTRRFVKLDKSITQEEFLSSIGTTIWKVELPSGLTPEGVTAIKDFVWSKIYQPLACSSRARTFREKFPEIHPFLSVVGYEWQNARGSLPKRYAAISHKYGLDLADKTISELGTLALNHTFSEVKVVYVELVNKFKWTAGHFGDFGSCFWGKERAALRDEMTEAGLLAMKIWVDADNFHSYSGLVGENQKIEKKLKMLSCVHEKKQMNLIGFSRCWVAPSESTQDKRALVLFNGYGMETHRFAHILSVMLGTSYKFVHMDCRDPDTGLQHPKMFINNSSYGYLIGNPKDTAHAKTCTILVRYTALFDKGPNLCTCERTFDPIIEGAQIQTSHNDALRWYCGRCIEMCSWCARTVHISDIHRIGNIIGKMRSMCNHCRANSLDVSRRTLSNLPGEVLQRGVICRYCNRVEDLNGWGDGNPLYGSISTAGAVKYYITDYSAHHVAMTIRHAFCNGVVHLSWGFLERLADNGYSDPLPYYGEIICPKCHADLFTSTSGFFISYMTSHGETGLLPAPKQWKHWLELFKEVNLSAESFKNRSAPLNEMMVKR